jgi:hypothetical protein
MSTDLVAKPLKLCKDGYVLNPITNICVKEDGVIGKRVLAAQAKAQEVAETIPRDVLLVIAKMLPAEHRIVLRLIDKQFAADIPALELTWFVHENIQYLMCEIRTSFESLEVRVSRNKTTSKRDTLLVKSFTQPCEMVHIIRYYDSKHSTVIAKYTMEEIEKSWEPYGIFKKTSPTDMVWLVSMMKNVWKVTYAVKPEFDVWNDWLQGKPF